MVLIVRMHGTGRGDERYVGVCSCFSFSFFLTISSDSAGNHSDFCLILLAFALQVIQAALQTVQQLRTNTSDIRQWWYWTLRALH